MNLSTTFDKYYGLREAAYNYRRELSVTKKIVASLLFACLTGILAQMRFYVPWSSVPITGQTFAVLTSGIVLGGAWGGISMMLYLSLGIAGIPWFTGTVGGLSVLQGPTIGYLVGFIFASTLIGFVNDKNIKVRSFIPMLFIMLFSNFVLVHGLGLLGLWQWFGSVKSVSVSFKELLVAGTIPFIAGDILKIVMATLFVKTTMPKV